ncbi:MAG: hypothetical protein QXX41_05695 [Nitrososphaerota archaeon]
MNLKAVFKGLDAIFIFMVAVSKVSAQTVSPGVFSGDWFVYDVKCFWSSPDPNATCPDELIEINETEWFRVDIISVDDSYVVYQYSFHFKNGTEYRSSDHGINLDSGSQTGGGFPPFFFLIAANLSSGDKIYPTSDNSPTINETLILHYGPYQRETNHVVVNVTVDDDAPGVLFLYFDVYFDRATGVSVDSYIKADRAIYSDDGTYQIYQTEIYQSTLILSNVWVVPEFLPYQFVSILIIETLLVAIILKNSRKSTKVTLQRNKKRLYN